MTVDAEIAGLVKKILQLANHVPDAFVSGWYSIWNYLMSLPITNISKWKHAVLPSSLSDLDVL